MDPNVLREHLLTLREQLGAAREVDPHSKQLLGEVMEDIERMAARAATASTEAARTGSLEPASIPDRLERIAVQFEADHPTLAASSRRLVDMLGKAGV